MIKRPLTHRTNRGQRSDEVLSRRGEGRTQRGGTVDGEQATHRSEEVQLYGTLQHFLQRDHTGEYKWKSSGINIYVIQNDIKRAGVRFFNVLPPHSSRDQAQDEKCTQEGVCP